MFTRILIANRGEIARRIIRTCRRMQVETVAVYSEADKHAPHVAEADRAVLIGPPPAADSYLRGDRIVAVALETGAQAIHPGYGFLSENAGFAQACEAAGLAFIGPPPDAIRAMALKGAAKARMAAAGVPVTPGYHGDDQNPEHLLREAARIGYPVLIKAVAGGGGKGMRRVDAPEDFPDALASAQREAQSAFADAKVLIETCVATPRHVEIQVFADSHGHVVHLFERDCSMQRRHQKVIEEAPAPGLPDALRQAMGAAAVRAAKAIGYRGAGTVEFIVDVSKGAAAANFWFMEMNTRLQVEHPVTEEITGLDLVEWQLRVAAGEPLPKTQGQIALNGHAVEARLYAEDPHNDFLPATGTLTRLDFPPVRVESAVAAGDAVSVFYDPMIAKLIAHGRDRAAAIAALREALIRTRVEGVTSNLGFLRRLVSDADFAAAKLDTGLIARRLDALLTPWPDAAPCTDDSQKSDPWTDPTGWRVNLPAADPLWLGTDAAGERVVTGEVFAPMPGAVLDVFVAAGQAVTKGDKLLILGAMKIEHTLKAPKDGVARAVHAAAGDQVADKALLVEIE